MFVRVKKYFILLCISLFSLMSYGLDAHVHGVVQVSIAVEEKQILLMLKSPAESLLGFEYRPRTKTEKEKITNLKMLLTKKVHTLFKSSKLESCKIASSDWKHSYSSSSHSSIYSETYLNCRSKLNGEKLEVTLFEMFPRVKVIHLKIISDKNIVNKKITNKNNIITL